MAEQLPLHYERGSYHEVHWRRVSQEFNRVIALVGLQQAAYDLDTTPSYLAHAMAERERKHPRASWLVYALMKDPTLGMARALGGAGGFDPKRRVEFTDKERAERLEGAVKSLDPDLAKLIMARAFGEGE